MESEYFHSNGKLLLTGEYLVLKGSLALAIPTKFGQSLKISPSKKKNNYLYWLTFIKNSCWSEYVFEPLNSYRILKTTHTASSKYLQKLLIAASQISENFISVSSDSDIISNIEFDVNWGLGSSSSLISNLSYWANIDPYKLNWSISEGSGYDIAASRTNQPILYRRKSDKVFTATFDFNPNFKNDIYFVYLGKKQKTDNSISDFYRIEKDLTKETEYISELSLQFSIVKDYIEAVKILSEHEQIISSILGLKPIKSKLFSDFDGLIKSLGAWGGDFIMCLTLKNINYVEHYFANKGLNSVFRYNDLIK